MDGFVARIDVAHLIQAAAVRRYPDQWLAPVVKEIECAGFCKEHFRHIVIVGAKTHYSIAYKADCYVVAERYDV